MQHVSFIVYQQTVKKYQKFFNRYQKNVQSGRFQRQSRFSQNKTIRKLRRLYTRMESMAMEFKLAMASSLAASMLMLTGTSGFAQGTLGPYTEVTAREDHPLPPPLTWSSSDRAYPSFADFDGDGDIDLLVTLDLDYYLAFGQKYDSTKLYEDIFDVEGRHLNVEKTSFFPDDLLGGYNARHMLAFVDIDNDGDLDAFTTNNQSYDYSIKFLYNNNGTFENRTGTAIDPFDGIFPSLDVPITFVDIDGDGDQDAFVGNYDMYRNEGSASLGDFKYYYFPYFGGRRHLAFFDIDGDNDMDAVWSDASGYLHLSRNDNAQATPPFDITLWTQIDADPRFAELNGRGFAFDVVPKFADVDGDGDDDLLVMERIGSTHSLLLFENNGGTLNEVVPTSNPFGGTDIDEANPAWGDIDNDGDKDLFIGGNRVYFYEKLANGRLAAKVGPENPLDIVTGIEDVAPQLIDIDGDGDLDAFIGTRDAPAPPRFHENVGDVVNWSFANDGPQKFSDDFYSYTGNSYNSVKPAIADVDGDGDYDVYIRNYDKVLFFYNNGINYVYTSYISSTAFNGVHMSDLDHDGDPDLILGREGTPIRLFTNDGNGGFTEQTGAGNPFAVTDSNFGSNPSFIDFDNDGDLDLFLGNKYYDNIRYFTNTNPPPTTSLSGTISWEAGDPPVQIIADGTISDPDGDLITQALVRISGFETGDQLNFTDQGAITGSWNASTAELLLSGTDTPGNYKTALNSITFEHTGPSPTNAPRTIEVLVRDQDFTIPTIAIRALSVLPNVPPDITATNSLTYGAGAGPVILNAGLTVSDANDTHLTEATVTISNFVNGEDVLAATTTAGITATFSAGVLTLSGTATLADYQTVLQSVTYENTAGSPTLSDRTILFQVNDGLELSTTSTVTVTVVLDPPPVISGPGTSVLNYTENDGPQVIEPGLTISDNGTDLVSGSVSINNYAQGEDVLSFTASGGVTGTFDSGTGVLTLSGSASIADYSSMLQSVQYENTSENPDATDRLIDFVVNDGVSNSAVFSSTIMITSVNDAPAVGGDVATLSLRSLTGAVVIDDQITITDAEGDMIVGAIIQVATNYSANEDLLSFVDQGGISGAFNSVTGTLTLSGTASPAGYEAAIRTVTFENVAGVPQSPSKTISFQVSDASTSSSPFIKNITVTPNEVIAANIRTSVEVGKTTTIDVLAEVTADPADVLTVSITSAPSQGIATLNPDQSISYTANAGANETTDDVIGYEICNQFGVCGSEEIEIDIANDPPSMPVTAEPGAFIIEPGGILTIPLTLFDPNGNLDPASLRVSIPPFSGAPATIANSELTIDYTQSSFTGVDELEIEVCDYSGICVQQEIRLLVGELEEVNIFNGVSPNNDGLNDILKLEDIEFFKSNEVYIYDKVGQLVYSTTNYNNTSNYFDGFGNNGQELPNGTYYLALFLTSANDLDYKQSGYFLLSR